MLVLLQQHRAHQTGDRGVIGEDADDAGAALDLLVDPLQQVSAPDLFQWGCGMSDVNQVDGRQSWKPLQQLPSGGSSRP